MTGVHSTRNKREMTNTYDKTIRKWIHKFNDNGIEGLFTKIKTILLW